MGRLKHLEVEEPWHRRLLFYFESKNCVGSAVKAARAVLDGCVLHSSKEGRG